ncbi:DUF692 family protein [soil metagenome]
MLSLSGHDVAVGVAISDGLRDILEIDPYLIDYVEVPFERLLHSPEILTDLALPVVLHCASLSVAGNLPPDPLLVAKLQQWIARSRTPWVGEHLAFVSMAGQSTGPAEHPEFAPPVDVWATEGERYNVSYTVSPQFSAEILERVSTALDRWEARLACPLVLENGPVYFTVPGSTMSQCEFISALCRARPATRLLLDLAHLTCTATNTREDPERLLESLPLENVIEVHLSGATSEAGLMWDDHAAPISPLSFALLDRVLRRVRPRAITIEYNWDPDFPIDTLCEDLRRVRRAIAAPALAA